MENTHQKNEPNPGDLTHEFKREDGFRKNYRKASAMPFKWRLNKEELDFQLTNYETITFQNSLRGIALIVAGLLFAGYPIGSFLVFGSIAVIDLLVLLILILIAYPIYKGKPWSIGILIFLTLNLIASGWELGIGFGAIIAWLVVNSYAFRALQVARAKIPNRYPIFKVSVD